MSVEPSYAGRGGPPYLHVGELRGRAPDELGVDEIRADVRAQLAGEGEAGQERAGAQAGDRDQLRFGLPVAPGPVRAREPARAPPLQRAVGGVARLGGEGLPTG